MTKIEILFNEIEKDIKNNIPFDKTSYLKK